MDDFSDKLESIKTSCEAIEERYSDAEIAGSMKLYSDCANEVAKAWSGSWFGYQSRVYYRNLQPVPAGARFSQEWGLAKTFSRGETVGDWEEYDFDTVYDAITSLDAPKTIKDLQEMASEAKELTEEIRQTLISITEATLSNGEDAYLESLKKDAQTSRARSVSEFVDHIRPSGQFFSRDTVAVQAGLHTPPHIQVIAELCSIDSPKNSAVSLRKIANRLARHLENKNRAYVQKITPGTHVFMGHGRSHLWKYLKDFIAERMKLPWDEFNRVPVAGITNITRLNEMLDSAAIAFIIMTAEDEQVDGKQHARMNVIHEAGLFQGRLGFTRAIILLEDGCEEFSNIHGLGQIRFPKGNIRACFEDVRQVLEREGLT
jgi:predicted nucleotide-binding protein